MDSDVDVKEVKKCVWLRINCTIMEINPRGCIVHQSGRLAGSPRHGQLAIIFVRGGCDAKRGKGWRLDLLYDINARVMECTRDRV